MLGGLLKKEQKTLENHLLFMLHRVLILGAEIIVVDPLVDKERINNDISEWLNNYGLFTKP